MKVIFFLIAAPFNKQVSGSEWRIIIVHYGGIIKKKQ
jgi:hypothetical protein